MKKSFFPNKRKNQKNPLLTDIPIRFHVLGRLGAGAARNREIMKPVRALESNWLNHL